MSTLWQDLRFGFRMMRKAPGFTAVAVLSLALGIGANTALFSLVDAVLLKTLPVKEPERLVVLNWQAGTSFRTTGQRGIFVGGLPPGRRGGSSFHFASFEKLRAQLNEPNSPLTDLFAFARLQPLNVVIDGQAEIAEAQAVSGGYFAGLGVTTALGRPLVDADDNAVAAPVAVISNGYWQERFNSNPSVVGKQIKLNQNSFTIVGVTPPGFKGASQVNDNPSITVPIAFETALLGENAATARGEGRGVWWLNLMGRLKGGATIAQARESLDGVFRAQTLEMMPPPRKANESVQIEAKDYPGLVALDGSRGMWEVRHIYSSSLYLLFGVVGLVLLIACANVANLLLSRAALRGPEITVRLAVGAGRWRLIRQLLTESVLLALCGGAVGVLFALWGKDALAAMGSKYGDFLPSDIQYNLNWRVLGFCVCVSLLTGVLFGLVPALRATRLNLTSALKEGNRGSHGVSRSRLSKLLVISQVAASLLLLVGAGLLIRTVQNLQSVNVGFNQDNLMIFALNPGSAGYKDERLVQFYQQLFARLDAIPGAESATFASVPLIANYVNNTSLILPNETPENAGNHLTNLHTVRENYFATMQIPLLQGRAFTSADDARAPKVAIVSEALAKKYFPGEDPIGKRVGIEDEEGRVEIVGVARDTKYNNQRQEIEPMLYKPWLQDKQIGEMFFAVRATGEPTALATSLRQAVSDVDNNLPVVDLKTQVVRSAETLSQERVFAQLLTFFALLALTLAAVGLYGVMAYSVAQRTNEIGIRMALGAQIGDVLRLVIWQGLKLVLIGLVVGAAGAFALKKLIATQLFGVKATDPLTYFAVGALLLTIALLACFIPARRAAKVDPLVALRYE